MTNQEVIDLMKSSKNHREWRTNCDIVKERCGGDYPSFWYKEIVLNGVMEDVLGAGSTKLHLRVGDAAIKEFMKL